MRPKVYCTCGNPCKGYITLSALNGKRGWPPYVCGDCRKPSKEYWESFIEVCECMSKFSSPYEYKCKDCHNEENEERIKKGEAPVAYKSWKWGSKQHPWFKEEQIQAEIDREAEDYIKRIKLNNTKAKLVLDF